MQTKIGRFTKDEAEIVIDFIANTPNIAYYSQNELTSFEPKNVLKIYLNNQLIGFCVIKKLLFGWFDEIAILGILNEYQNLGIGKKLFLETVKVINQRRQKIYTITRNPRVISFLEQSGFQEVRKLPISILLDNFIYTLSFVRIKEYFRKKLKFKNQPKFRSYIKKLN